MTSRRAGTQPGRRISAEQTEDRNLDHGRAFPAAVHERAGRIASDTAEAADFAVIDDIEGSDGGTCEANSNTKLVTISASPSNEAPVIYLSTDGPADYRIFVRSNSFSARRV